MHAYILSEWREAGSIECKYIFDKQGAAFALQWRRMDTSMLCHRKKVTSTSTSPSRVYRHSKQLTNTSQEQVQSLSLSLSQIHRNMFLAFLFFSLISSIKILNCLCCAMLNDAPKTPNRNCSYQKGGCNFS
jgi:hypothetical protein